MGSINRIVTAANLDAAVAELTSRLAKGPTFALGHMRHLMRSSFNADLPLGIQAFLSKTMPAFTSR